MMAARYYFDTQGLVRERKVTVQKRAMCGDGVECLFLINWGPVNFGDDDLIDRWTIEWWDEKAAQRRTFFATFATAEEAEEYVDEWRKTIGRA
jgi:hypothetical protein